MQRLLFLLMAFVLFSCATPVSPTGGEADRSGPKLIGNYPENETTSFSGNRLIFEFDDFVDRPSFEQAFRIEPELNIKYSISWRRKTARINFEEEFPENMTIVFSLSTDLQDARRNRLQQPIQLAISTGPVIDRGRISAEVLNANTGEIEETGKVFLYREPFDLTLPANYIGEPDTSGRVIFNYLAEGRYKAFWVDDRNRNRIWNPETEKAQPFYRQYVALERNGEADFGTIYIQKVDTIAPRLQAVGMHGSDRMRMRFSKPVVFSDSTLIEILNADGDVFAPAVPLFTERGNRNVMFAQVREQTEENVDYGIRISKIFDSAGNQAISDVSSFPGSAIEDTVLNRFIGEVNAGWILHDEPLILRYAKVIDEPELRDSLMVVDGDAEITDWSNVEFQDNLMLIYPDSVWIAGLDYEFRIWNPGMMDRRTVRPRIFSPSDLGEIEISLHEQLPESSYLYVLKNEQDEVVVSGWMSDTVLLTELPPGNYRLIIFDAANRDTRWNSGKVLPYQKPDFYEVFKKVPVQRGLTGSVLVGEEGR